MGRARISAGVDAPTAAAAALGISRDEAIRRDDGKGTLYWVDGGGFLQVAGVSDESVASGVAFAEQQPPPAPSPPVRIVRRKGSGLLELQKREGGEWVKVKPSEEVDVRLSVEVLSG